MSAIGMNFNQLSTVLNSIVQQATGQAQITPTNTEEFVSVAQVGLKTGYDPLLNAISQVLSKTIFSIRPYSRKFAGLLADPIRYGNHVRKLQVADKPWEDDDRIKLVDGESVDQYVVDKPAVLQTNFYGENVYQKKLTIFRDQLDVAFSSPEEFGRFISMIMQNASDMIEQAHEQTARMTVANFIAGKYASDSDNCVYLLDLYEDETGITGLTPYSVKQPENFAPFAKWLFGYLKTVSELMTERTIKFHKNFTINGNLVPIARHTPMANQKVYLFSRELNNIDASVLSSVYHTEFLKIVDHEAVNYWQSIDTPMGISVKPTYNDTDGTLVSNPEAVVMSNVFGVIFDEEAIGYTPVNQWSATTPFNARGGYSNIYWHFTDRYWNDFTENAVVLILDHSDTRMKALTVSSVAGTDVGDTKITVSEPKGVGNSYFYKTGASAVNVVYGEDVSEWTSWDGESDITPTSGDAVITVVEANANDLAIGMGYANITVKEESAKAKK